MDPPRLFPRRRSPDIVINQSVLPKIVEKENN